MMHSRSSRVLYVSPKKEEEKEYCMFKKKKSTTAASFVPGARNGTSVQSISTAKEGETYFHGKKPLKS